MHGQCHSDSVTRKWRRLRGTSQFHPLEKVSDEGEGGGLQVRDWRARDVSGTNGWRPEAAKTVPLDPSDWSCGERTAYGL